MVLLEGQALVWWVMSQAPCRLSSLFTVAPAPVLLIQYPPDCVAYA
jgi:hypothetical protein